MAQYLRISKVVRSFYESISYSDKVGFKVVSWIFFIMHREYGTVVFFRSQILSKTVKDGGEGTTTLLMVFKQIWLQ